MVLTAVVNEDQLEGFLSGLHDYLKPVVQFGNVLFFVVKRDNNRVLEHYGLHYTGRCRPKWEFRANGAPLVTIGRWRKLLFDYGLGRDSVGHGLSWSMAHTEVITLIPRIEGPARFRLQIHPQQ